MVLCTRVVVEGIPFEWSTNLDESGIREFYGKYSDEIEEKQVSQDAFPSVIRISLRFGFFDLKAGFCFWNASGKHHTVIYRTHYEWEIWDARQKELHELEEEQKIELSVEEQILSTEDNHLKEKTEEAIDRKDFESALAHIEGRIAIRQNCARLKELFYLWRISHLWWAYTNLPTSTYGIDFLLKHDRQLQAFLNLAHWFAARCGLERGLCVSETLRIYEAAKRLYPNEGSLAKHECLFLRRMGNYEMAIRVCLDALERGLKDNTKSGFEGRLKRLRIEAQRQR